MYLPYFRGKQFELIAIRETVEALSEIEATPVIEPVKKNLSTLERTIETLKSKSVGFILIINPKKGDFKNNDKALVEKAQEVLDGYPKGIMGYIVDSESSLLDVEDFLTQYDMYNLALIHYGFPDGKSLKDVASQARNLIWHVFIDGYTSRLYRRNFRDSGAKTALLKDGFRKVKNADYPEEEPFSDLHITFQDESVDDFGDFLIVGDEYSETGGPAYAIAIHLTYLNEEDDMWVKHFLSDRTDSPVDHPGKFYEALAKLQADADGDDSQILRTSAVEEFIQLFEDGKYPGLGYVKKLSMIHHVELIKDYILTEYY